MTIQHKVNIHGTNVYGPQIDHETRCTHYHTQLDIIAIKFYCCGRYYPCKSCHDEAGCGKHQVWPADQFDQKAILCGACGTELTINEYLNCDAVCPSCHASFNPGCSLHKHYYFQVV
ncbi:CHY zinc finger protein [Jeotgalibacillus sp. R-1-5s-1]|uniref:CHY zinc finger protein n=1 Tax=Jeotgalibacillus sp. R-1-5s-1 TaxID=2555897 RepID=UPI00106A10FF|nr:CHY zinc finger protein [Jeotgalibacillus sp. R-1-5s-1]TFE02478.1 hypothetical protein E2491_02740 [Jeotgalibacillus sp. R-1-5s-1]